MKFHHFGLAVRKPEKTLVFLKLLGYQIGAVTYDELQRVNLIMCNSDDHPDIEIIYPGSVPSPVDKIIELNNESIYHCCYEISDLNHTITQFRDKGLRVLMLSPPTPAILFGGRNVSFYRLDGFGVVEFLETCP
jgi:methylmalonyl-CoA/ethylmalonyl-CoA epimerase